jgi:hypothetical protein
MRQHISLHLEDNMFRSFGYSSLMLFREFMVSHHEATCGDIQTDLFSVQSEILIRSSNFSGTIHENGFLPLLAVSSLDDLHVNF